MFTSRVALMPILAVPSSFFLASDISHGPSIRILLLKSNVKTSIRNSFAQTDFPRSYSTCFGRHGLVIEKTSNGRAVS
jgi:hypothetical protein